MSGYAEERMKTAHVKMTKVVSGSMGVFVLVSFTRSAKIMYWAENGFGRSVIVVIVFVL